MKKKVELTEAEQLRCVNMYLACGHGRGRLISGATVYDGKVGYFCVHPILICGKQQGDGIIFVCDPHEDVLITAFPLQPNAYLMSEAEAKRAFNEARRAYLAKEVPSFAQFDARPQRIV